MDRHQLGQNTPTNSHALGANDEPEAVTNNLGCQGRGQPKKNCIWIHHDCDCDPDAPADCGTMLMTLPSSLITLNRTADKESRKDCPR